MSDKKTITINPDLFRLSNTDRTGADDGGTKRPRQRKPRASKSGGGSERGAGKQRSKELRAKQMRKELIRKLKESNKRKSAERRERERELERAKQPRKSSRGATTPSVEEKPSATPDSEFDRTVATLDRVVKQHRQRPAQHTFKAARAATAPTPQAPATATAPAPAPIQIRMPAAQPVVPISLAPPRGAACPPRPPADDFTKEGYERATNLGSPALVIGPRPPTPHAVALSSLDAPPAGLQPVSLKADPPYGCLKVGGSKPTYSQYTMKRGNQVSPAPPPLNISSVAMSPPAVSLQDAGNQSAAAATAVAAVAGSADPAVTRRRALLQALRAESQDHQHEQHLQNLSAQLQRTHNELTQVGKKVIKKRYLKRTFKVGKAPGKATVPVLIRNQRTRRNIDTEVKRQCEVNIVEKKRYLKRRHLLKHGSVAPDYIIHDLYRNAITAGELENKGADVLLHNYLHGDEDA